MNRLRVLMLVGAVACGATQAKKPVTVAKTPTPVSPTAAAPPPVCEPTTTRSKPDDTGVVTVASASGASHPLYWTRLKAKTQPAKGTVFYLAGGPQAHFNYTDMAAAFQKLAFPSHDVVLYDFYGFNCSNAIHDAAALRGRASEFTMTAMAGDFIELKRHLVGAAATITLMGGSHGAMLGSQIVRQYPAEIERAILFSGDTETGWYQGAWFRFDDLLSELGKRDPAFARSLDGLLEMATQGKLTVKDDGVDVPIDREHLETMLFVMFMPSAATQAAFPKMIPSALTGHPAWMLATYRALETLIAKEKNAPTPTNASAVRRFHQCNVWFPKSTRVLPSGKNGHGRFVSYDSFVHVWDEVCKDYDPLGEFPWNATAGEPLTVPILSFDGDHDYFDPQSTASHWSKLSSKATYRVMPGWAHDFGVGIEGFMKVVDLIKAFMQPDSR